MLHDFGFGLSSITNTTYMGDINGTEKKETTFGSQRI